MTNVAASRERVKLQMLLNISIDCPIKKQAFSKYSEFHKKPT